MFGGNNTSKEYTESAARELADEDNSNNDINKENEEDKRNRTYYGVLNDLRILDLGRISFLSFVVVVVVYLFI